MQQTEPHGLRAALGTMLGTEVAQATYDLRQLQGGTLADVQLVTGEATTADGLQIPYRLVWKVQKKWQRPGDPHSWRREYDLYSSPLGTTFTNSFSWPACYHKSLDDERVELWLEFAAGASGEALTLDMLALAARELGRYQGSLLSGAEELRGIACLGDPGFMEREFSQWHTSSFSYEFLVSPRCRLPQFIKEKLKEGDISLVPGKSFEYACLRSGACGLPRHLKEMLLAVDERQAELFSQLNRLPIVLCHRDYWIENLFVHGDNVRVIDWDTAGWGFLGEDIASLIADDTEAGFIEIGFDCLIQAYLAGLAPYMKAPTDFQQLVLIMILIKFGYRMMANYMYAEPEGGKNTWGLRALEQLYEVKNSWGRFS